MHDLRFGGHGFEDPEADEARHRLGHGARDRDRRGCPPHDAAPRRREAPPEPSTGERGHRSRDRAVSMCDAAVESERGHEVFVEFEPNAVAGVDVGAVDPSGVP